LDKNTGENKKPSMPKLLLTYWAFNLFYKYQVGAQY